MHLSLHLSNYYSHSNIKHDGSPIQLQRSFQENEKEVIVAGHAPKCHHREADSAEGGLGWGWGSSMETMKVLWGPKIWREPRHSL